jgi:molybdate transport system substrate-binding protein
MAPAADKNTAIPAAWSKDWEVAVRVWIERRGKTMLADGLADVLAAIDKTNSISAAGRLLGISYRHAWKLVSEGNAAAGEPLVTAATGGLHGGGAQLTPRGKLSLEIFEQLRGKVNEAAAGLLQSTLASPAPVDTTLHLAAAISLQEVVGQALTEYALRQPSIRVRAVFGASNELADHVLAGAPCDLFLSADAAHLDRLAARLGPKSRRIVAANGLAAIGTAASPKMASPRDLLQARQVVLADPACPLGKLSRANLTEQGFYDELLPRVVPVDNSRGVLAAIRSGRAEAGLAFASDAAAAEGCRLLFAVAPNEASTDYWAGVCRGARQQDATALLEFFSAPAAQRCFRRCGLSPPKPQHQSTTQRHTAKSRSKA